MISTTLLILTIAGVLWLINDSRLKRKNQSKTEVRIIRKYNNDTIHFFKIFNELIPQTKTIKVFEDQEIVTSYVFDPIKKTLFIEAENLNKQWTNKEWERLVTDGWEVANIYTFHSK